MQSHATRTYSPLEFDQVVKSCCYFPPHNTIIRQRALELITYAKEDWKTHLDAYHQQAAEAHQRNVPLHEQDRDRQRLRLSLTNIRGDWDQSTASTQNLQDGTCLEIVYYTHWHLRHSYQNENNVIRQQTPVESPLSTWYPKVMDIRISQIKLKPKIFPTLQDQFLIEKVKREACVQKDSFSEYAKNLFKRSPIVDRIIFFGPKSLTKEGKNEFDRSACRYYLLAKEAESQINSKDHNTYVIPLKVCRSEWFCCETTEAWVYAAITEPFAFEYETQLIEMITSNSFVIALESYLPIRNIIADLPQERRPRMLLTKEIKTHIELSDDDPNDENSVRIQQLARSYNCRESSSFLDFGRVYLYYDDN